VFDSLTGGIVDSFSLPNCTCAMDVAADGRIVCVSPKRRSPTIAPLECQYSRLHSPESIERLH
jgi:hypothetical protein